MNAQANYDYETQVAPSLKAWQQGYGTLDRYIAYHRQLAKADRIRLEGLGYQVHREWEEFDGWMDGMKTTHMIIESPDGELMKIKWHDSHHRGQWFKQLKSGGSVPVAF